MAGPSPAMTAEVARAGASVTLMLVSGTLYILTNRPNGTLYTGVTADLSRRVFEHRQGRGSVFTRRYKLTRLVYYEHHEDIAAAIQRERNMKHYDRAWKVRLILTMNPTWDDLYEQLNW